MALVIGGGATGGLVVSAPSVPAISHPMAPPMMSSGSANAESAAGGAWDLKAWEKDYEDSVDASSCICIAIGRELHASVWELESHRPAHIPFVANSNDEEKDCVESHSELKVRQSSNGLQAVVNFGDAASARRIRKWFEPESRSRLYATLPSGVSVGTTCCGHGKQVDASALQIRPLRLLGLQGKCCEHTEEFVQSRLQHGKMLVRPIASDIDDAVFSRVEVELRLQRHECKRDEEKQEDKDEEEMILEPEDLVAMMVAHVRRSCADVNHADLKSCVAFAVPSWWGDVRRSAIASAASRAGVMPLRMASAPLCTAIGLCKRLSQLESPSKLNETFSSGRPVLLVSEDSDSIDVMLLQASDIKSETEINTNSVTSWRALSAGAGGLRTACTVSSAVQQVIRESTSAQDIVAVVLLGEVNIDTLLSVIAIETGKHRHLLDTIPVLFADGRDTADGLAYLIAAELGRGEGEESPLSVPTALDVCSESVSLIIHPVGNSAALTELESDVQNETLLRRGQELPAKARRLFTRAPGKSNSIDFDVEVLCSRNTDLSPDLCHQHSRFASVLTYVGDDGIKYPCESVVLVVRMSSSGTLMTDIEEISSSSYEKMNQKRSWGRSFLSIFLVFLVAISIWARWSGTEISLSTSAFSKREFRPRLEAFLRLHNPSKLKEVDNWIRKYDGREKSLVDMLERKYGAVFPQIDSFNRDDTVEL